MIIELLTMGGYGKYIWPAYGVTMLILGLNMFLALREKNKIHHLLKQYLANRYESHTKK